MELSEQEQGMVAEASAAYFSSLNDREKELMGVTQETITGLYAEYALANKVYQFIIRDINPEISDDEARTITVQHVLIKTYALDGTGARVEYTENAKEKAYKTAREVLKLARDGEEASATIPCSCSDSSTLYSLASRFIVLIWAILASAVSLIFCSSVTPSAFAFQISEPYTLSYWFWELVKYTMISGTRQDIPSIRKISSFSNPVVSTTFVLPSMGRPQPVKKTASTIPPAR